LVVVDRLEVFATRAEFRTMKDRFTARQFLLDVNEYFGGEHRRLQQGVHSRVDRASAVDASTEVGQPAGAILISVFHHPIA
jgi:hypothetical protein